MLADFWVARALIGIQACCIQLWLPSRDGDAAELSRLLSLDPWTVDEPGRDGQAYTNALQVACAGGHIECVRMLLDCGAIFRDSDWNPEAPRPFVCNSVLSGAGYAPPPAGSPSSSAPKTRVPREVYIEILDLLLGRAAFCEGDADRELLKRTR